MSGSMRDVAANVAVWGIILVFLAVQLAAYGALGPGTQLSVIALMLASIQVMLLAFVYQRLVEEPKGIWMLMMFGVVATLALIIGVLSS